MVGSRTGSHEPVASEGARAALVRSVLLLALLAIFFELASSSRGGEPRYPQAFRALGNLIVDEQGNEVVLRGLALGDPVWLAMGEDPDIGRWDETLFHAARSWGARVVRLSIHPAVWRHYGPERALVPIDQAIAWARRHRLYVIIDFHSVGYPPDEDYMRLRDLIFGDLYKTSRQEIRAFWRTMALRYGKEPVVAFFELFNESAREAKHSFPAENTAEDWKDWRDFNESLIDIIRLFAPDKPVLVGGFQFAYDLSYVTRWPVRRDNVIYATHVYPESAWKIGWDEAFGELKKTHPVFLTEFGFGDEKPESLYEGDKRFRDAIVDYVEARKIGWTAWAFSAAFTPRLLTDEHFSPSEQGAFIKDVLRRSERP